MSRKSPLGIIFTVLTIICYVVTIFTMAIYLSFSDEINRMVEVGLIVKTRFIEPVSTRQLLQGAAKGMAKSLGDPYSVLMSAREFSDLQNYIEASIGGIGVYLDIKDRNLIVVAPIKGTPAYRAGIKKDDLIIKIDDKFTSELTYEEAVALMRGEPGTQVKINIVREGAANILEFTMTREKIDVPTVDSEIIDGNIGYLRLNIFASNTDEAVNEELKGLLNRGIKGLILDVRDNPGGDLEAAVNIAKRFVPQGPVVYLVDRNQGTKAYESAGQQKVNLPLVVLINGGSASASEVLAGAIKDTVSGILIGEKTFGKGLVQGVFYLARGEGLKLTTSKYLTPNKIDIHEKGIEPDIFVGPSYKGGKDAQLEEALLYLKGQLQ